MLRNFFKRSVIGTRQVSAMTTGKPKVLRIGITDYATEKWQEFSKIVEVVNCDSSNRQQFLQDLKTKYLDITHITRTLSSVEQTGRFDAELASQLPATVKAVCHCAAGYDQIDVDPLSERGIQVSNVTTPVQAPTTDTAVYLVLATLRNFQIGHDLAVQGKWPQEKSAGAPLGHEPSSRTLGILGMGGIGRMIRDRLKPFGFKRMIYHNRSQLSPELENGVEYVDFDLLLGESDVICISVPLNDNTKHLINKETLAKVKKGAIIVNTARGAVINEADLLHSLQDGSVGAFGSDVFEFEPYVSPDLLKLPNVVSLPHMGTHTYESLRNMESFAIDNALSHMYTGKVKTLVSEQRNVQFDHVPSFTS